MAHADENTHLRDAAVRRQIGLLRVSGGYVDSVHELLDTTEPRLRVLVERFLAILSDERVNLGSPRVQARLDRLRQQIEDLRTAAMADIEEELEEQMILLVLAQFGWFGATVATVTAGRIDIDVPPRARRIARDIVRNRPFEGRTLQQWVRDLAATDARRIYDAVVVGLLQDSPRRDILRSVFGTARLNGRDGVTQRTRHDIEAITSTAVTSMAAQAVDHIASENADLFPRDVFTAVLDNRTTPLCRSLDGKVYLRGKGPIPPLHFRCRSIRVALLPGQVPDRITYAEWLRSQSPEAQKQILGATRAKLFRAGGMTLDRFVTPRGRLLTLEELAKLDAAAFRAAGLDPKRFL